jgi:putative ABC transport system permease protein
MSTVSRGMRNAFRNPIRTVSVIALLGISSALALALLLANQAVKTKVVELKKSAATTLTVRPAGQFGGEGGGEPLKTEDINKVKALAHVSDTSAFLMLGGKVMINAAPSGPGGNASQPQLPESKVQLDSSVNPGTLGARRFGVDADQAPAFKLPVAVTGLSGRYDIEGNPLKLASGSLSFSGKDVYEAILGKGIAEKNNKQVGSTFTAYGQTFKVIGIVDAGDNQFASDAVMAPLATVQRLGEMPDEVSSIFVKVDSIENLDSVKTAVGNSLGNSRVDITSAAQNTTDALAALAAIQQISLTGSLVALGAAAVITFLIMVMIVRERRREIGVLKAIGSSNMSVVSGFVTEALVLSLCGTALGIVLAAFTAQPITGALVNVNAGTTSTSLDEGKGDQMFSGGPGGGQGFARRLGEQAGSSAELLSDLQTTTGATLLLQGFLAALGIAALGSAVPAFLIAKVRPAEVMRGE